MIKRDGIDKVLDHQCVQVASPADPTGWSGRCRIVRDVLVEQPGLRSRFCPDDLEVDVPPRRVTGRSAPTAVQCGHTSIAHADCEKAAIVPGLVIQPVADLGIDAHRIRTSQAPQKVGDVHGVIDYGPPA